MKIKVCGLKYPSNVRELAMLSVDYAGFVFVDSSPRYVQYSPELMLEIQELKCQKVGVFVNAPTYYIRAKAELFGLDVIQLHGDEIAHQIKDLAKDYQVIKAISVGENTHFDLEEYEGVSAFLFDTKGAKRGGNGYKFNWDILSNYKGNTPFYLSGGIGPGDVEAIRSFDHPLLAGIDVNSGFEVSPGIKNMPLLQAFIEDVNGTKKAELKLDYEL